MTESSDYNPTKLSLVPEHMREGVQLYIEDGIEPGRGLWAVLSNDLTQAVASLDDKAIAGISGLVQFLYSYAPPDCWGERRKVQAWLASGGLAGRQRLSA